MRGVECPGQWWHEQRHVAAHVADDEQVNADGRRSQRRGHQLQPDGQRHADPHLACARMSTGQRYSSQVHVRDTSSTIPQKTTSTANDIRYRYTKHTAVAHEEVSMLSN